MNYKLLMTCTAFLNSFSFPLRFSSRSMHSSERKISFPSRTWEKRDDFSCDRREYILLKKERIEDKKTDISNIIFDGNQITWNYSIKWSFTFFVSPTESQIQLKLCVFDDVWLKSNRKICCIFEFIFFSFSSSLFLSIFSSFDICIILIQCESIVRRQY